MEKVKAEISFSSLPAEGGTEMDLGVLNVVCKNGYGKGILALPDLDVRREEMIWTLDKPNLIGMVATL